MKKPSRRSFIDDAGRLYVQRQELLGLKSQRDQLEQRIRHLERKLAEAEQAFDAKYERVVKLERTNGAAPDDAVTPGKLPHRVLSLMKRDPSRLYTATELSADLGIRDVQQVRTALARLVGKGLARRAGAKGQFTP